MIIFVVVLFDTDYTHPMVYPSFCYQKSITAKISTVILDAMIQAAWLYYSIYEDSLQGGGGEFDVSFVK